MHIASFQIANYKSFRSTPETLLTPGFNVIVGQNNVGKTALVEALSLTFAQHQHRSMQTAPARNTPVTGASTVTVLLQLSRDEVFQFLARLGNFYVPVLGGASRPVEEAAQALMAGISDTNTLKTVWQNGTVVQAHFVGLPVGPTASSFYLMRVTSGTIEPVQGGLITTSDDSRFERPIANLAKTERIYRFNAERLNVGTSPSGWNTTLRPNASNLPEVLQSLQGRNPYRLRRLNEDVRTIFPDIQSVSVRPVENNLVEILIWPIDPATEREDLAFKLDECGTGIGQVLALLYVVLTADTPQVILIDEPQSFLHPGAVRKLIEILKSHREHQFIITTHSPTAVNAADPDVLFLLRQREAETVIERLDVAEAGNLRVLLAEVGARLSDVFGADNILWVEGRTEEDCFPKILRQRGRRLLGTAVVGVIQTGDFEGRRSKMTVEIYEKLSRSSGLLPPAIGFIFDREGRRETELEDLRRRGRVFFISRRMYENYLLNPAAIAATASGIAGFRDPPLTESDVRAWLDRNRWEARYFVTLPPEPARTLAVWLNEVNGAKLLADLFSQLSENRVTYDKVQHGVALTDWILEHSPDDLREVGDLVERALGSQGQ
jgi:ABC-type cobalamin/Fe3+-siderophores transport system ATPase subunit